MSAVLAGDLSLFELDYIGSQARKLWVLTIIPCFIYRDVEIRVGKGFASN